MEVILGSHAHHVPQVGLPQIAPVTNAIAVRTAPTGAAARIVTSAILIRQIRLTAPANAIT